MTNGSFSLDRSLPLLRCPTCGSSMRHADPSGDDVERLTCVGCGARWPIRFGIPDLRGNGEVDPYLSLDDDLRAADKLHERSRKGSFEDTLASYYELNDRVPADQARRFIAGAIAAEDRARAVIAAWRELARDGDTASGTWLDAGCGTGPLLAAAAGPNVDLIGVDVGMRWLVLAAARLRDRGVEATLLCAGAQRLPLHDGAIDLVASESLYDNVPSAPAALAEGARVLRGGGWLCLTTPNRWSVGPDPHVGIPLGGWMPDRVVAAWATRRGMVPPRRHLLGARDLRAAFSRLPFSHVRLGPPPVADSQLRGASSAMRAAATAYRAVARSAGGHTLLLAIGPSLLAVARREGTSSGVAAN